MRFLWAGLIVLSLTSGALAQANGYVRELGFDGNYRPDCWTPLLVHLESTVSEPAEYQIQVHQQDLDQDTVVFTRTVTLGPQARENVWVYFQPQPTSGGLPGATSMSQLGDVLKVHLYDKSGKTHITNLPVQAKANSIDVSGGLGSDRGVKLVLVIAESGNPHGQEYVNAQGVVEDVLFIPVRLDGSGLPDHVLGYQMVDAILWLDAKLNNIRNTPAFGALQQWIRQGGNFAICQQSDRSQLEALIAGDMLPVVGKAGPEPDAAWAIQLRQKKNLDHLVALVRETSLPQAVNLDPWAAVETTHQSFELAYAEPRPDAIVEAWIRWSAEDELEVRSPFIARRAYGMGSVTWVAQELGSNMLNAAPDPNDKTALPGQQPRQLLTNGWPRIWDRVFGWRNQTRTSGEMENFRAATKGDAGKEANYNLFASQYAQGSGVDIGMAMINRGIEHGARSTAYVFLAVLFFVIYWIAAGPGSYFYLATKKKTGLSWTIFGASALAATLLTVVLVKLLLRGGAEARHMTLVQLTPDGVGADGTPKFAAQMHSRMGLYIPRDGEQIVSMEAAGPNKIAAITPFAVHPEWSKADTDAGFTDTAKYYVDTDPILAGKAPSVGFPYRSTLKKVEARWAGTVPQGIVGAAAIPPAGSGTLISGTLTNRLGRDLKHVYLAFTPGWIDASDRRNADVVLYLPAWQNGASIDLNGQFQTAKGIEGASAAVPGYGSTNVQGRMEWSNTSGWSRFWYEGLSGNYGNEVLDDRSNGFLRTFPMMSLIDRVGPLRRKVGDNDTRPEPIRRGGRNFNVSQLIAAGRLVVMGQAVDSPVPLPMQVNGGDFESQGVTFYQIGLPLDRSAAKPVAATQPASQPATNPAKRPAASLK